MCIEALVVFLSSVRHLCPKVKVQQSMYRPGHFLRVPEGWGSQISRQSVHKNSKIVSRLCPSGNIPGTGWVDPRVIVRLEGISQWKIPVTTSRIETATFWLVAQCLNQLRHRMPNLCLNLTKMWRVRQRSLQFCNIKFHESLFHLSCQIKTNGRTNTTKIGTRY